MQTINCITHERYMEIRKFNSTDAKEVSNVIRRALAITSSKDYPPDYLQSVIEEFSPEKVLELSKEREMFVAVIDSKVVGTGSLLNDTIYTLFVNPDIHGKGIGKKLMEKLEALARANHISELIVPASYNAIGFYEHLGYKENPTIQKPFRVMMSKKL